MLPDKQTIASNLLSNLKRGHICLVAGGYLFRTPHPAPLLPWASLVDQFAKTLYFSFAPSSAIIETEERPSIYS
jgi:hypothetical protein